MNNQDLLILLGYAKTAEDFGLSANQTLQLYKQGGAEDEELEALKHAYRYIQNHMIDNPHTTGMVAGGLTGAGIGALSGKAANKGTNALTGGAIGSALGYGAGELAENNSKLQAYLHSIKHNNLVADKDQFKQANDLWDSVLAYALKHPTASGALAGAGLGAAAGGLAGSKGNKGNSALLGALGGAGLGGAAGYGLDKYFGKPSAGSHTASPAQGSENLESDYDIKERDAIQAIAAQSLRDETRGVVGNPIIAPDVGALVNPPSSTPMNRFDSRAASSTQDISREASKTVSGLPSGLGR